MFKARFEVPRGAAVGVVATAEWDHSYYTTPVAYTVSRLRTYEFIATTATSIIFQSNPLGVVAADLRGIDDSPVANWDDGDDSCYAWAGFTAGAHTTGCAGLFGTTAVGEALFSIETFVDIDTFTTT